MTSSSGTLLFLFAGQLNFSFAICLAVPCGIAALFGSRAVNEYINRTKKSSILLFMLLGLSIFSFTILIFNTVRGDNITMSFKSFCK
jgi:uncharacterized membrane protein YfcA